MASGSEVPGGEYLPVAVVYRIPSTDYFGPANEEALGARAASLGADALLGGGFGFDAWPIALAVRRQRDADDIRITRDRPFVVAIETFRWGGAGTGSPQRIADPDISYQRIPYLRVALALAREGYFAYPGAPVDTFFPGVGSGRGADFILRTTVLEQRQHWLGNYRFTIRVELVTATDGTLVHSGTGRGFVPMPIPVLFTTPACEEKALGNALVAAIAQWSDSGDPAVTAAPELPTSQ